MEQVDEVLNIEMTAHSQFDMNEYLAKTVLEQLPFTVLLVNMHGNVCYGNESSKTFLEYDDVDIDGMVIEDIVLNSTNVASIHQSDKISPLEIKKAEVFENLAFCQTKSGKKLLVDVKVKQINLWNGRYDLYTITDMTPYRQQCESVNSQAHTDSLTSVYNRRGFDVYLEYLLEVFKKNGNSLALMLVDIDDFKRINDIHGHHYGDEVLVILSSIIKNTCREVDIVSRYGGDELAILLPDTSKDSSQVIANRILQQINAHDWVMDKVTSSVGFTVLNSAEYQSLEVSELARAILACADKALYRSKQSGKNRISYLGFCNPGDCSSNQYSRYVK